MLSEITYISNFESLYTKRKITLDLIYLIEAVQLQKFQWRSVALQFNV